MKSINLLQDLFLFNLKIKLLSAVVGVPANSLKEWEFYFFHFLMRDKTLLAKTPTTAQVF
jgi:hypothetical protein